MEKLTLKIVAIMLITILSIALIPTNAFAAESKNVQVVKAENGDYIVYVQDLMAGTGFSFATSENSGETESSLSHIRSVPDNSGENQVAVIEKNSITDAEGNLVTPTLYLYIDGTETALDLQNAFDVSKMEEVETTTKRINTTLKTNIEQRNEEVNGIRYTETVGGLEITDENKDSSTYEYVRTKLPDANYSELQTLADELNNNYSSKNMYEKIEFAKGFYEKYKNLIDQATWQPVENYLIKQPIDAQKGDKYIVLLKRTAEDGTVTYDAKFLESYREDNEEKIPGRTETKTVQETAKLPITGDNLILFAVLAVIIIALIVVFTKMRKEKNQGKH